MQLIQRLESRVFLSSQTFGNPASITIDDGSSPPTMAGPYPSSIEVSGMSGLVTKVTVQLKGIGHDRPQDVDVLLAGPGGAPSIILLSDIGGTLANRDQTLTFDDGYAAIPNPWALFFGTYRPTNLDDHSGGDGFPAPAPAGAPSGTKLSAFNGVNPNGTWSLYITDDSPGGAGEISGGWSITITTVVPPPPPPPAPSIPDLDPASDTGWSNTDNITADNTPTFIGTAEPGSTVHLLGYVWDASGTADADGNYRITAPALPDSFGTTPVSATASNAGGTSPRSDYLRMQIDTKPPTTTTGTTFDYNSDVQTVRYVFSEPTGPTFTLADVTLLNVTTSAIVPASKMLLEYGSGGSGAAVTFPGFANGVLPDGRYRAMVPPGTFTDAAGNVSVGAYGFDFFTLAGDAHHDGKVDIYDLSYLTDHWQEPAGATFHDGDFNYDHKVDVIDLGMLASNWQVSVAQLGPAGRTTSLAALPGRYHREPLLEL